MVAAKYNHAAVAKALLEGGSKPHFKSEAAPFNAVVIARLYDHIETFSELAPDAEKTRPLADSDDFEKVSLNAQSSLEEIVALTALPGI
jgi:ankyrin repeat protein